MGMKASYEGIDWDRLQPEDYDFVKDLADSHAARPCTGKGHYNIDHAATHHYTTIGGETRCTMLAARALLMGNHANTTRNKYGRLQQGNSQLAAIFSRALGTTLKAAFAAHVKEGATI